ncbi:sugar transferase [Guptibacillus spartinae]|uniref:sugar transferase n=1 Tax=Guptibacillus spartinae TaxID=3025679 RepID=UPI00235F85CC|nr:sugar transferase [Pseudalkalibacillus spartinae]
MAKKNKRSGFELVKRLIDLTFATLGLVITMPIFLFVTCLYLFGENKGPVLFKQIRIGRNGERFKIYKFRSMVQNADLKLKQNARLYEKYLKNNYKLEPSEDPRITNVGKFLRSTSLDELPQLINILKGEMSLVGPRPVVEEELIEYKEKQESFLSVKPGLTGFWQISGRSNVGYPERVDLELFYVNNKSLFLDIKILLKTFIIVFIKRGAY